MAKRSPTGILVAALIWIVVLAAAAAAYRFLIHPRTQSRLEDRTGSARRFKQEPTLALDSFSGYCLLRSDGYHEALNRQGIRLRLDDDGADYAGRLAALRNGDIDLAVFTIDSLLKAGAEAGELPGTIVLVIDETKGADAIVAYKTGVPTLDQLDDPRAGFVLTPDSPSEFLARVAVANFNLPRLPDTWLHGKDGADAVYRAFRAAPRDEPRAYVLWEPYVSKALKEKDAHVLLDSGKLSGYIMDVLVVRRAYLSEQEEVVRRIVETYLREAYAVSRRQGMADLVVEDARNLGLDDVGRKEARALVEGIAWRNTLENYLQFGLMDGGRSGGLPHIEDATRRILDVLLRTAAIDSNPWEGRLHVLYYDKILRQLKDADFHPGNVLALEGGGEGLDFETVRGEAGTVGLTDEQWASLVPMGEMRVEALSFARGTARLNLSSERHLTNLAGQLKAFPHTYLRVTGHARAVGDLEANLKLSGERAEAALAYLVAQGTDRERLRADAAEPSASNGSAQSVTFELGQLPY